MELRDKLVVRPDKRITLADWDPAETLVFENESAVEKTEKSINDSPRHERPQSPGLPGDVVQGASTCRGSS